ncbi:MAG: hypothetical protein ABR581_11265 [Thermoleophilaceae bacterium]
MGWLLATAVLLAAAFVVAQASAHVERASYWPNPAPDRSVHPATGGAVPSARSLYTALRRRPAGATRVACRGHVPTTRRIRRAKRRLRAARRRHASHRRIRRLKRRVRAARRSYRRRVRKNPSIRRLRRSAAAARAHGYKLRPSERPRSLSRRRARRLVRFNERLLAHCHYHAIQRAVSRSRNNDRVVIMPGTYSEPASRAKPTNDSRCANLREQNDKNETGAVSYRYQAKCPNDQNLVAVIGRLPHGKPPQPPRDDRHGIPDLGPCIRCNVQIEGSGVQPDDVVVDAGRVASGNHGPIGAKKDVGIRADRADGFVLRNVTVRHAGEHNIYILESDGYRLERFKTYYAGEYGVLTFVEDHGLIQDCDAAGFGDAALYPGAGAETGEQASPRQRRLNQEIRHCDMRHSMLGYSGTDGNAVHVHDNRFYGNTLGLSSDVFTASGHPGFPQDSDLIEHNYFYSNNFNPYVKSSDIAPTEPVPIGVGLWWAGGNNNTVRYNRFWDNWRRGTMLLAVPDAFVCGPAAGDNEQHGCKEGLFSTSYRNRFYGNVMGRRPSGKVDPNGEDFWWDQGGSDAPTANSGNCWYRNIGRDRTAGSITSTPPGSVLPSDCSNSPAPGGYAFGQNTEESNCLLNIEADTHATCPWFETPAEPK